MSKLDVMDGARSPPAWQPLVGGSMIPEVPYPSFIYLGVGWSYVRNPRVSECLLISVRSIGRPFCDCGRIALAHIMQPQRIYKRQRQIDSGTGMGTTRARTIPMDRLPRIKGASYDSLAHARYVLSC